MTDASPSYPIFGLATPANMVTFGRIAFSPLLFYVILQADGDKGTSWLAFAMGIVFAGSDIVDGKLARRSGHVSRSGAFLDPFADKVVVLGVAFCFVAVDRLALLPVAIIAIREVGISLLRIRYSLQGLSVPASKLGKWKTSVQGAVLGFAAFPPLLDSQRLFDVLIWVPVVAITVVSGLQYLAEGRNATNRTGAAL